MNNARPAANKNAGDGGDHDYRCPLAAGPDPPPDVVSEARSQIRELCSRLAALGPGLGVSNCRCPAGYGP